MQSQSDTKSMPPTQAMVLLTKSVEQHGQVIEIIRSKEQTNSTLMGMLRERFSKDQEELDSAKNKIEKLEEDVHILKLENLQCLKEIETLQQELKENEMYMEWGRKLRNGGHHLTELRVNKGICELSDDVKDSHYVYFQEKKKIQENNNRRRRNFAGKKPYDRPAPPPPTAKRPFRRPVSEPVVLYSDDSS